MDVSRGWLFLLCFFKTIFKINCVVDDDSDGVFILTLRGLHRPCFAANLIWRLISGPLACFAGKYGRLGALRKS